MPLTQADAIAVKSIAKLVNLCERELISDTELVEALFQNVARCESDIGIEQCVALVPKLHWQQIDSWMKVKRKEPCLSDFLAIFHPTNPTELERQELNERIQHAFGIVANYLANPTGIVEYEIDDLDGLRNQWFLFRQFESVIGEPCRSEQCDEDRIRNSVYCPVHHYEMVFGQSPPDLADSCE